MTRSDSLRPDEVLLNYFRAKDGNRPQLLALAFQTDAVVEVRNESEAITFPAATDGRDAIAAVFVRRFGQTYENVYSFYLQRPVGASEGFSCDWLVAMTEKDSRAVRVGCGRYDWTFAPQPPCLASRLVITISSMVVLPPSSHDAVLGWVSALTYPWVSLQALRVAAPELPEIQAVLSHLSAE